MIILVIVLFVGDCVMRVMNHELAATYISVPVRESIIGDEELSFQVRNGTGRFLFSIATRIVN